MLIKGTLACYLVQLKLQKHEYFPTHFLEVYLRYPIPIRFHVPNNWVLRVLVIVIIVQVLGKYRIIRYLDP